MPALQVIPGFMCQGGDFTQDNGTGGFSIYGARFAGVLHEATTVTRAMRLVGSRAPPADKGAGAMPLTASRHGQGDRC